MVNRFLNEDFYIHNLNNLSANNQILIVPHQDKYYVFDNVSAESWDEKENTLLQEEADAICETLQEAYEHANYLDEDDPTEYGVYLNRLAKDGEKVVIV